MFLLKPNRRHSFFLFCSMLLLSFIHNGSGLYAQGPNIWTQKANFGGTARDGAFAFSVGSLGYIGGGNNNGSFKNDLWEYNPATNAWTQKAGVPSNEYLASSFTIGSKAYIGCGYNTGNAFYEYDPVANTWAGKASMPGTARYITMGFSIGSKGYCGTGYNPNNPYNTFNDFYEFDPVANTWTVKASIPGGGRSYAVGFGIGSKGYAGTGNIGGNAVRDFYEYDPTGDTWTAKANVGSINRMQSFGIAMNSKGYVGGGGQGYDPTGFYEYDPGADTWTAKATIPVTRAGAVGFAVGTKLYIGTGGDPFDNNYYGSNYYYRNDFYEWSSCGPIVAVSPASAFICGSGSVTLTASGASTYTWSNGMSNGGTVSPSTTTAYTVTGALTGTCAATNNAIVTVVVNNSPANQSLSVASSSFACNGSTSVNLSTQVGVNYYLRNDATNAIIAGPVAGTGGTINIPTGNMVATTTLNVNAKTASGALLFDGIDDGVKTSIGNTINFTGDFSMETWIKAQPGSNPGTKVIIGQPGGYDVWVGLENGGYPNFTIGGGTTTGTFVVNDGKWHHIAAVRQSGTKYLYIDGVLAATGSNGNTISGNGTLEIGAYTGSYNFKGLIDDVKIWNTARTQVQVSADMTACVTGPATGLLVYYNFEEASGSQTSNMAGLVPGATLVNMAASSWSYGVENCVACAATQLTTKPVITVGPITNQTVTAVNANICVSGTGTVTTSGSEKEFDYFLRDNSNNAIVMGPVDGTGSALSFTTGLISTNKTYNVFAKSQSAYLEFDGTNDVVVASNTVGVPSGNSPFTMEALIKPDPANPIGTIMTWGNRGTANESTGFRLNGSGQLFHYWWANDIGVTAGNLVDGAWHHVAATYDGTTRSIYVDGVLVGSDTPGAHNAVMANGLSVGGAFISGTTQEEMYKGGMDEVRVWNIARTPAQISANMNNSLLGSESGLTVYYKFADGTSATTVKDLAGGDNTGTLTNMNTATAWQYYSAPCTLQMSTTPSFTINALPTVGAASITICVGSTGTITPSGASTYTINGGSFTVSPSSTTSYSITGTSAVGCVSSNTAVTTVSVNALPVVTASASNSVICTGAATTLNGGGATTYTWTSGVSNNVAFSPTTTATYTVTGTNTNGCKNTATRTVTVNALPVVTANATNTVICRGASVTLNGGGATTYTWTSGISNNVAFTPTSTVTYTVTGTDANACVNSAAKTITVNALPLVSVNNGTICTGNSFTIVPTGATTYTYSGGNSIVSPTANSSYSVNGTDNNGCVSLTAVSTVSVNSLPVVTANSGSVCSGASFTITPSGATTYTFSGGSPVVSPATTTGYSVTGTGANGCVSLVATSTVTVIALPVVSVNSGSICSGESFTLSPSGAVTYTYSGGSATVSPTANTSYSVTGTAASGCVSLPAISTLTVNVLPSVTVNNGTICTGSTFTITPNGASTYTVTGGSYTVNPTTSSAYTVTGTSTEGCTGNAVSTVSVQNAITMSIAGSNTVCSGQVLSLSANGATTYTWNTGATSTTITATPTVNTTYSVSGISGVCAGTAIITITVNALPSVSATTSSSVICRGNSVTLTGAGASSYTWSTGAQTSSVVVSPTVTTVYNVTGKNTAGCTNTVSLTQVVNPCTGIEDMSATARFINVYPNPSNGEFTIELYEAAGVTILDVLGKVIYTQTLADGKHPMDLKEQAAGLYILKVNINGKEQHVRLIKQ
jgi:hypothetical protein